MNKSGASTSMWSISKSVLPAARHIGVLFGLTSDVSSAPYINIDFSGDSYSIERKILPNNFARIDIVRVNGNPVGSVLFVEIADGILHMVGMFVRREFRGKKLIFKKENVEREVTIASFLLSHVMEDIVSKKITVTLEVMNYNTGAYRLYENWIQKCNKSSGHISFELCSKEEVQHYSRIRHKPIEAWHDIESNDNKMGVQWSHVPDYGGVSTYSISRVYVCKLGRSLADFGLLAFWNNKLKLSYSAIRYGSVVRFVFGYLRTVMQKKVTKNDE